MSDFGLSQPSGETVSAVVKWFNPTKGFGFVQPTDGSPDAFLHVSILEQAGYQDIQDSAKITCQIGNGPKGPQVTAIFNMEPPDAGDGAVAQPTGEAVEGRVKFFDAGKGFGFIVPDNGEHDVFVSARLLERSGIMVLEPDQRVRVTTRMGQKGPMAESVELI
ncbi:MAG: cold-shock protein [Alphaproteobacteria bacterium]